MNILIVYWHPEPLSFNAAMLKTAVETLREEHAVVLSDLYRMSFNPVSGRQNFTSVKDGGYFKQQAEELYATENNSFSEEIEREISKVEKCDLMIWQFPLWWFGLPAVLKGWVDRVFAMGRTYGNGKFYENGTFRGKTGLLSLTTGGPDEAYQPGGFNGDINGILRPVQRGILEFLGFQVLSPNVVYGPAHLAEDERKIHLENWRRRLNVITNEQPIMVGQY